MPITKLGQVSSSEISDLQQKHFDIDMRLRDQLTVMSLEQKMALLNRLPGLIDEIKLQLAQKDVQNAGM
jgi:hypothetical protein